MITMNSNTIKKASLFATSALLAGGVLAQTAIPLLKDGQVVSADTFNDIFQALAGSSFKDQRALNSEWECTTEELTSTTPTANQLNAVFTLDATTGVYKATNTWSITNDGKDLTVTRFALGGMGAGINYTGACPGETSFSYSIKLLAGGEYVAFKGADLCTIPNTSGIVGPLRKLSTNSFMIPFPSNIVTCVDKTPVPDPANDLTATAGLSGVSLTWAAPSGGLIAPSSYKILRKDNGSFTSIGTSTSTSYSDTTGKTGNIYRIVSSHANGDGLASSAAKAQ